RTWSAGRVRDGAWGGVSWRVVCKAGCAASGGGGDPSGCVAPGCGRDAARLAKAAAARRRQVRARQRARGAVCMAARSGRMERAEKEVRRILEVGREVAEPTEGRGVG